MIRSLIICICSCEAPLLFLFLGGGGGLGGVGVVRTSLVEGMETLVDRKWGVDKKILVFPCCVWFGGEKVER